MLVRVPDVVYSDENGLQWLAGLATRGFRSGSVDIEVPDGVWIDANLRAAWGAIVNRWREKGVHYRFVRGDEPYAFEAEIDRPTCLPYETFSIYDEESWAAYALRILSSDGMPAMSERVRDKLSYGILELFLNARQHSDTKYGIFACGHAFKKQNKLRVSIADAGIGFKRRLELAGNNECRTGADAIDWAMCDDHTVKKKEDGVSGGIGLKDLRRFIELNDGKLSILSDDGLWELSSGQVRKWNLDSSFPGTLITITVRTDDQGFYRLRSEVRL